MVKDDRRFSAREVRGVLWLLPFLVVAGWLVFEVSRVDGRAEARGVAETTPSASPPPLHGRGITTPSAVPAATPPQEGNSPQLFVFDPNTVEYHDLVRLGFSRGEALGIIKYRERGKVFEIAEDFAACYQVSEAMYRRLEPWIRIGVEFRLRGVRETTPSAAEATVTPALQGEELPARGYSSERVLVDLNAADSAALIGVSGIGAVTVGRILEYRQRLGGFAAVEQLAEVRGVTEQNYLRIVEQIYVDPADIRKIDINFVPAKSLASHPYFTAGALRKLLKERQLKGGWRSITELETDDIFTAEELDRLGPYLVFN